MILEQEVDVQLTPRLRKNFIKKGYSFESVHSTAIVKVRATDLPRSSRVKVTYQCDGCGSRGESVYFALLEKARHTCRSCSRLGKAPSNKFEFDEVAIQELVTRFQDGQSAPALAESFGTTPAVVRRALKDAGVSLTRPSKLSAEDEKQVIALYENGLSMPEIGRRFGVSKQPIGKVLQKHGVSRRSTSEATKGRPAHNRREFTADQVERMRILYEEQGQGADEIAREFNLDSNTPIHRIIRERGFAKKKSDAQARREKQTAFRADTRARLEAGGFEEAKKLFAEGLNFKEIASKMELDSKTLITALKRGGLENAGAEIPLDDRKELLLRYGKRKGQRARELARKLGFRKQVVLNFLCSRGIDTANAFGFTESDVARMVEWSEDGFSTAEIAYFLSKEKNAHVKSHSISERLSEKGQKLGTYTRRYLHPDPLDRTRMISLRGGWEKDVARYLDKKLKDGEIAGWQYEGIEIPYSDGDVGRTYTPDFLVERSSEKREIWEVKGRRFAATEQKIEAAIRDHGALWVIDEAAMKNEIWPQTVEWDWSWHEGSLNRQGQSPCVAALAKQPATDTARRPTEAAMLEQIRSVAEKINRTPSMKDLDANSEGYASKRIALTFGKWNGAIEAAGLAPRRKNSRTPEELGRDLQALSAKLGRAPTVQDFRSSNGIASYSYYKKNFGSLEDALAFAGVSAIGVRRRYESLDDDTLIRALQELAGRIDREPDTKIIEWTQDFPSLEVYKRRFGSATCALKRAGFTPRKKSFVATDGHRCDSGAERLIDEFLTEHGIKHDFHPCYPPHPTLNPKGLMAADWKLEKDGRWVEYFGVQGNARYDQQKERKRLLAEALHLDVIYLEVEDLDPPRLRSKLLGESHS